MLVVTWYFLSRGLDSSLSEGGVLEDCRNH
jgi:hypothetical protein